MPRKKKKPSLWLGISLLFILLIGGTGYLVYSTWKTLHKLPYYANQPLSEFEDLKFEHVFRSNITGILGIDISQYQGRINWKQFDRTLKNRPIEFLIIRATMGDDRDDLFASNWAAIDTMSLARGAYHYYRPNQNSTKQAENFIRTVQLKKGDFRPILDIEKQSSIQSKERLREGIRNWLNLVESHYGVKPIIYTGDAFFEHVLKGHGFEDYPLWVANYNPVMKPKSDDWVIWQFSEKGRIKGIPEKVDLNLLRGGEKTLKSLLIE
ncbi:glycoside hydrolase family 25 protein [Algoriphagus marinus]|uniref:glycoside hydrolase family 25 protein n=1 Tax=Algoriphagus marinus TaxID=1925762 RepID=UPI00094BC66F|nr:glycoside hydrolase family 25 protein [Algoriphagus marinus]